MKKITFLLIVTFFITVNEVNAQQGAWYQQNGLTGVSRSSCFSFSIGTKGYIGTGSVSTGKTSDFWEFNSETNTWTQKANFGGGDRWGGIAFSIGSKGYAGIGANSQLKNDFWEYDPPTNTWTQKTSYPGNGRLHCTAFMADNKGYVVGGSATSTIGNETKELWEYDPLTDSWSQKTDFGGNVRDRAIGFTIYDKGYVGTGYHYDGSNPVNYNDFWQYDPATDSWIQIANFPGSQRSYGVGFSFGNKGFAGLGYASVPFTDLWMYDPDTDSWSQMAAFPAVGRLGSTGLTIGNSAYVGLGYFISGGSNVVYLNDFWKYENNDILGSTDFLSHSNITLFPNPVSDILNIKIKNMSFSEVLIYDVNGKLVQEFNTAIEKIDFNTFNSGLYFLKIKTPQGIVTKRIIKK